MPRRTRHFIRSMEHLQIKLINIFTLIGSFQSTFEVDFPNQRGEVRAELYMGEGNGRPQGWGTGKGHPVAHIGRLFSRTQPRPRVPRHLAADLRKPLLGAWEAGPPSGPSGPAECVCVDETHDGPKSVPGLEEILATLVCRVAELNPRKQAGITMGGTGFRGRGCGAGNPGGLKRCWRLEEAFSIFSCSRRSSPGSRLCHKPVPKGSAPWPTLRPAAGCPSWHLLPGPLHPLQPPPSPANFML